MSSPTPSERRRAPWWSIGRSRGLVIAFTLLWGVQTVQWSLMTFDDPTAFRVFLAIAFDILTVAGVANIVWLTRHPPSPARTPPTQTWDP